MSKYKCIRKWPRNKVGDVIEKYLFNRYPKEIRDGHFKEIVEKVKKVVVPNVLTKNTSDSASTPRVKFQKNTSK